MFLSIKFIQQIGKKRKQGLDTTNEVNEVETLSQRIIQMQNDIEIARKERDQTLSSVGNLLHSSVPISKDEVIILLLY